MLPAVFAECRRALAPGGPLMLVGHAGTGEHTRPAHAYGGHPVSPTSYRLPPDRIAELLGRAGLVVTARLVQEPGEGMKGPVATLIGRADRDEIDRVRTQGRKPL